MAESLLKESVYWAIKDQSKPPSVALGGKGNMLAVLQLTDVFHTSSRRKKDGSSFEKIYIGYR